MSSGLLGHGVAIGAGLALAARLKQRLYRTVVLLGDGECQAGIVWEGAMTAAKYRLSNLTVIIDYNKVQLDGPVAQIMPLEPLTDKWLACGWVVFEVDGHTVSEIADALAMAARVQNSPTAIIAHTTKGKGVSFMEDKAYWHGIAPNPTQLSQALAELGAGSREVTHG